MPSIKSFIKKYNLKLDEHKCTEQYFYLRSSISTEQEACEFVEFFGATTASEWVTHYDEQPPTKKYAFCKTWACERGWNKTVLFQTAGPLCDARIKVLCKKSMSPLEKKNAFSKSRPPLLCIILLFTQHNHGSLVDDHLQIMGLTTELKEKFFEYFQNGMNAVEARLNHDIFLQSLKGEEKYSKISFNLTNIQVHRLHANWLTIKGTAKHLQGFAGLVKVPVTEFIKDIPKFVPLKKNTPLGQDPIRNVPEISDPFSYGLEPPLEFIPSDSTVSACEPLLFKLRYGPEKTFVTRLTLPQIVCITFGDRVPPRSDDHLKSLRPASDVPMEFEAPDLSEEEDIILPVCSNKAPPKPPTTDNTQNTILINLFPFLNCLRFMPLTFSYTGTTCSQYEMDSPLLFTLKRGQNELTTTIDTLPKLHSVFIDSSHEIILTLLENGCKVELENVPIHFGYQKDFNFPPKVAANSSKRSADDNVSPKQRKTTQPVIKNDEDYQFLMSFLPDLRQMPTEKKQHVKTRMQEFMATNRICARGMRVQESRRRIYRECDALRNFRDCDF